MLERLIRIHLFSNANRDLFRCWRTNAILLKSKVFLFKRTAPPYSLPSFARTRECITFITWVLVRILSLLALSITHPFRPLPRQGHTFVGQKYAKPRRLKPLQGIVCAEAGFYISSPSCSVSKNIKATFNLVHIALLRKLYTDVLLAGQLALNAVNDVLTRMCRLNYYLANHNFLSISSPPIALAAAAQFVGFKVCCVTG